MKFTIATLSIKGQIDSKQFKRDITLACKDGIGNAKLTDIADRIAGSGHRNAIGVIVNEKIWEQARDDKRKARSANGRIITARANITNVLQFTANAVGATLSATKHALETNHAVQVERKFLLEANAIELDGVLLQCAKDGVKTSCSNNKWYKHKHIKLDFATLVTNLHEQAAHYYKVVEGK